MLTTPGIDAPRCQGSDVLLTFDRVFKRAIFAEAGVPFLLLVDPPEATAFELVDGEYRELARSEAGRLSLTRPFPFSVDLGG